MQIEVGTVKGFQDILPPESQKREEVQKIIEKSFKMYGFAPLETPVVEFDELMRSDVLEGEDESVSERFRLRDKAGRNLGLRYEFTFQLARIFKQYQNIKLPFRRYQIGNVFRDEPTGPDRFRQLTQCDADIIGDASINADAECLALLSDILKELKIEAEIHINNRKLLSSVIESVEIRNIKEVMRELDKKDKIGEDMMKLNLKKYADANQIVTLMKMLQKDLAFFRANAFDGSKELEELQVKCRRYGVALKLNPFMIRGLSYYTGNIFEAIVQGKSSIAGGGRFDKLVGKYSGKEIPAVGISLGLERLTQLANIEIKNKSVMVISIKEDSAALKLTRKIRAVKIPCIPFFDKINKGLELANFLKIPHVIFLGEDEIKKERFKLRDMVSGEETFMTERQLIKLLLEEDEE